MIGSVHRYVPKRNLKESLQWFEPLGNSPSP